MNLRDAIANERAAILNEYIRLRRDIDDCLHGDFWQNYHALNQWADDGGGQYDWDETWHQSQDDV